MIFMVFYRQFPLAITILQLTLILGYHSKYLTTDWGLFNPTIVLKIFPDEFK